jgi:type I restriction enzyme S subunit
MKNPLKYSLYKDSEVEWLHEIPSHWNIVKAKRIFHETSIKNHPDEPLLAATQTKGVIPKSLYENTTVTATKNFETLKFVKKGDFVISLRSFQGGIEYAHYQGIISPAYTILEPQEEVVHKYYRYLLKSKHYISGLTLLVTGIREGQNIDTGKFKDSFLPLPPYEDQAKIATFLDYKLAKINSFIAKKKQLIKLLNEQKAGIINHAVTKGLDPNAIMKDSGVEWLGNIPEKWEVKKLKYSVRLNQHIAFDKPESQHTKIALENIEGKTGRILELNKNSFEGIGTIFKKGDILFGKLRPYLAKVVAPNFEGSCVNELLVLTPNTIIWNSEFLKFRMLSSGFIKMVDNSTFGAKMPRASWDFIGGLKISCPPLDVQKEIVLSIEEETFQLNQLIQTIEKEIVLTQEYRTALIAEAVTGKIDVRAFVIPTVSPQEELYEEIEEELDLVAEDTESFENE